MPGQYWGDLLVKRVNIKVTCCSLHELRDSSQWHIQAEHGVSCPPIRCLVFHVFIAIPEGSHHISPLKLCALPPRSSLQRPKRPKSWKVTTSAATERGISQEISRRKVVSFLWAACEVIGWQLGRSLKNGWSLKSRATSLRSVGASRCFKVTAGDKDLNTVSSRSVQKAPLKNSNVYSLWYVCFRRSYWILPCQRIFLPGDMCKFIWKRLLWHSHDSHSFYMILITAALFILSSNAWGHGFTFARLANKNSPEASRSSWSTTFGSPRRSTSTGTSRPAAALEGLLRRSARRRLRGAGRRAAPRGLPERRLGSWWRRHVGGWKPRRPWGAPHSGLQRQGWGWILGLKLCCLFAAWTSAFCPAKMQEKNGKDDLIQNCQRDWADFELELLWDRDRRHSALEDFFLPISKYYLDSIWIPIFYNVFKFWSISCLWKSAGFPSSSAGAIFVRENFTQSSGTLTITNSSAKERGGVVDFELLREGGSRLFWVSSARQVPFALWREASPSWVATWRLRMHPQS